MDSSTLPFIDPFWGPVLAGAGSAALALMLGLLAATTRRAEPDWTRLSTGGLHWAGLVLSAGLAGLIAYVERFIDSSRADRATQMQIAGWMALAFAGGALFSLWHMRRIARAGTCWREGTVRFRMPDGALAERPISAIRGVQQSAGGWFIARFGDGAELRIDPYTRGAEALLERIAEVAGKSVSRPPWR